MDMEETIVIRISTQTFPPQIDNRKKKRPENVEYSKYLGRTITVIQIYV
jgi:hypothetical protein